MKKNLLSVLLALVLVLGLTVFAAPAVFAEENTTEPTAHSHCYCVNAEYVPEDHECITQEWTALAGKEALDSGYYYLSWTGIKATSLTVNADQTVYLCLNGAKMRAQTVLTLSANAKLIICDCSDDQTGIIGTTKNETIKLAASNEVILYSGTITGANSPFAAENRLAISVNMGAGTFTMYGGTIKNGNSSNHGGNVLITSGSFTMYGGTICDGKATNKGGNVALTNANGRFYMYGGTISGGEAGTFGGNISLNNGAQAIVDGENALITAGKSLSTDTAQGGGNVHIHHANGAFTLDKGTISDGEAATNGGNIFVENGTATLNGGIVTGGTAGKTVEPVTDSNTSDITEIVSYEGNGGSIYVKVGTLTVDGATVSSGSAKQGGNIFVVNDAKLNITTGTVSGGMAYYGGNIYGDGTSSSNRSTITLSGGTVTLGQATSGGNIYTKGSLVIEGGTVSDGVSIGTAGNIRVNGTASLLSMSGGIVSGGKAADNGGNFYIYDCTNAAITGGQILNGEGGGAQGGGNIYVTHQKLAGTRRFTLANATVSGGKAAQGNGGNLYARQVGTLKLTDVTMENGSATGGDNVYLRDNLNVDITGGTFTATYGGRRFTTNSNSYTEDQLALITQYGFNNPGSDAEETGNGGNICIYSCGNITTTDETTAETTVTTAGYVNINGATILGGNAENGGAIYVGNGNVTLDGVTAKSCGGSSGKVLNISKNGTATVKDSTLVNWGIQGSTIVNNGNLILQGNINMPKEYNASEMMSTLSITQDILIKCSDNANAVMDITDLTSVDADVVNVENVIHGDGVLLVGRSENTNSDGDVLNTAGLVANGVNDNNRALIVSYNTAFTLAEQETSLYLANALIQGVTENGNLTGGGANFDDVTNDGKTSVVYYILNGDLTANAGTIGKDIYLNLNGHTVTGATVAEDATLYLMDMANDGYDASKCGSFSGTVNGTLESITHVDIYGGSRHYVILKNEDGSYSAHRYLAYISDVSLHPVKDALGYKASFQADTVAQAAIQDYGINLWVSENYVKTFAKSEAFNDNNKQSCTARITNILAAGGGETVIYGEAFINFKVDAEGTIATATTSPKSTTMKKTVETVNGIIAADNNAYNETQMTALQELLNKFSDKVDGWAVDSITGWTATPEETIPEETTEPAA